MKEITLGLFVFLLSIAAYADSPKCSQTFPAGDYSSIYAQNMEVRSYRHQVPATMTIVSNPNILINSKGEVDIPKGRLVIQSANRPEGEGLSLKAPEGMSWSLRVSDPANGLWHYTLKADGAAAAKANPARVVKFPESEKFKAKKEANELRDVMELESQVQPVDVDIDLDSLGLNLAQRRLVRDASDPAEALMLENSLVVANRAMQYLVISKIKDTYIISFGKRVTSQGQAMELEAIYAGYTMDGPILQNAVLRGAVPFFSKIQISEEQMSGVINGSAVWKVFSRNSGAELVMIQVSMSALSGPTLQQILKEFANFRIQ